MTDGPILVTGIGGLIGGAVIRRLLEEGRAVIGTDREVPDNAPFPVLAHDLPDPQRWHDTIVRFGIKAVVHAGSISGPMLLRDAPARLCDINLGGLLGLLEAARIHRLRRVVWFSSILAYGERPDLALVDEDTPLNPTTVYGATKAAGEALLRAFHAEHGVDAVALRVASCYGPGRTTSCLIRTLIEDGITGRVTRVQDPPDRSRQHIFVGDVVDATCAALLAPSLPRRAYNIGPGVMQNLDDIVHEVRAVVPETTVERHPDGLGWNMFPLGALAIDAARRDLGFAPRTTWTDGVRHTRRWVEARGPQ
jgi:UDP-glucose 4-epimerase